MVLASPALRAQSQNVQEEIDQLRRSMEEQRRQLLDQQRRLDALQRRSGGPEPPSPARPQGTPPTVGQPGESPDARLAEIPALVELRGVLTPRNSLVIEPSLQYAHSTNNRVALVGVTVIPALTIGLIDIRSVQRDTLIAALSARYGVTNRFELEARLPYVWRKDTTVTRPLATPSTGESVFDASGNDIGDVEFAARYQLNRGGLNQPYYVANLRVKTRTGQDPFEVGIDPATNLQTTLPTGSGFIGVQPSLTAIFPSDPAVFFGSLSYLWNVKRDVGGGFGTIDPGDAVGFNFGMGLALNEKASFSLAYDHNIVLKTKQNGDFLPTSTRIQLGTLLFGVSYRTSPRTNLNLSVGVGVTAESPDLQLTLRLPFAL
jgi:hypothetical protein